MVLSIKLSFRPPFAPPRSRCLQMLLTLLTDAYAPEPVRIDLLLYTGMRKYNTLARWVPLALHRYDHLEVAI